MGNELTKEQEKHAKTEAHHAFEDLKKGRENNDLNKIIDDVEKAKSSMSPKEYDAFLKDLNKETKAILPEVEIVGTKVQQEKHELVVTDKNHDVTSNIESNEGQRLDLVRPLKDHGKIEKRGNAEVEVNDKGEVTRIRRPDQDGDDVYYIKGKDGKWTKSSVTGSYPLDEVSNLTIDSQGNVKYDMKGTGLKVEELADGRNKFTDISDGSTTTYHKPPHNLLPDESTDGKGHTRKFHYDKEHRVDMIDGHLGHWDRKTNDKGQTLWENKETKAVWAGDFTVEFNGDLTFKGHNGVNWTFTAKGRDRLEQRKSA